MEPFNHNPNKKLIPLCNNKLRTCDACLTQSINVQIGHKEWDCITCPDCPAHNLHIAKTVASPEAFEDMTTRPCALPSKAFQTSSCLSPDCDSCRIHEDGYTEPIMKCNSCHFKTFVVHKLLSLTVQACEEFDNADGGEDRMAQERASAKYVEG